MVFEKVANILTEYKDVEAASISPETTFEELELDSLDKVELIMSFEEEFKIQIKIESADAIKTVQDLVDIIEKQLSEKEGAAE